MIYTTEQIEGIAANLREMLPVEKKNQPRSKQEAIKMLSIEISALKRRDYSMNHISETLRGEGLDIATPTLKSDLQWAKAKAVKKASAKAPSDTPAATPAAKTQADTSEASFTPTPDSDDI